MPTAFEASKVTTSSISPRCSRSPGMHLGHDLLLAVTIAVALLATLLLYCVGRIT